MNLEELFRIREILREAGVLDVPPNPTKVFMARVVVMAYFNLKQLPAEDHFQVKKQARRLKVRLEEAYHLSLRVLAQNHDKNKINLTSLTE